MTIGSTVSADARRPPFLVISRRVSPTTTHQGAPIPSTKKGQDRKPIHTCQALRRRQTASSPMIPPRNSCATRGSPRIASPVVHPRLAEFEHQAVVGHLQRRARVLFDHQDRRRPCRAAAAAREGLLHHDGDRPIEGSSIRISLGSSSRPRTISSCFCSPPESVEACWSALRRSAGKRSSAASRRAGNLFAIGRGDGAELDVVAHRELGKMLRPCGM